MSKFKAVMLVADGEKEIEVGDFNGQMAIYVPEGPILITKEQAIKFFNLTNTGA